MFQVGVPRRAGPGTTLQVQSPYGNTIQVQVPEGVGPGQDFQVIDPLAPQTLGAPGQRMMGSTGGDIFHGAARVYVKQEMAVVELCGIEAKQRYRISVPNGNKEGAVFLYITEESDCVERICCGTNRSLKLRVHGGATKDGPVIMEMNKPFQGWCCMRPSFSVSSSGQQIGEVDDPCRCCLVEQEVYGPNKNFIFKTAGTLCQTGIWCSMCAGVYFDVTKHGQKVAQIERLPMETEECCLMTNRFMIDFNSIQDPQERKMLLASAMLLDLAYFEETG